MTIFQIIYPWVQEFTEEAQTDKSYDSNEQSDFKWAHRFSLQWENHQLEHGKIVLHLEQNAYTVTMYEHAQYIHAVHLQLRWKMLMLSSVKVVIDLAGL